jgi:hypothetical protein
MISSYVIYFALPRTTNSNVISSYLKKLAQDNKQQTSSQLQVEKWM